MLMHKGAGQMDLNNVAKVFVRRYERRSTLEAFTKLQLRMLHFILNLHCWIPIDKYFQIYAIV